MGDATARVAWDKTGGLTSWPTVEEKSFMGYLDRVYENKCSKQHSQRLHKSTTILQFLSGFESWYLYLKTGGKKSSKWRLSTATDLTNRDHYSSLLTSWNYAAFLTCSRAAITCFKTSTCSLSLSRNSGGQGLPNPHEALPQTPRGLCPSDPQSSNSLLFLTPIGGWGSVEN